jgi:hypothetical protein
MPTVLKISFISLASACVKPNLTNSCTIASTGFLMVGGAVSFLAVVGGSAFLVVDGVAFLVVVGAFSVVVTTCSVPLVSGTSTVNIEHIKSKNENEIKNGIETKTCHFDFFLTNRTINATKSAGGIRISVANHNKRKTSLKKSASFHFF